MDLLPKSSTHRRSKQPSTKSSESSENDKLARFSSADEDAPLMPRAAVPSPLLAATMRSKSNLCTSSWQEPYCTHIEYLF